MSWVFLVFLANSGRHALFLLPEFKWAINPSVVLHERAQIAESSVFGIPRIGTEVVLWQVRCPRPPGGVNGIECPKHCQRGHTASRVLAAAVKYCSPNDCK